MVIVEDILWKGKGKDGGKGGRGTMMKGKEGGMARKYVDEGRGIMWKGRRKLVWNVRRGGRSFRKWIGGGINAIVKLGGYVDEFGGGYIVVEEVERGRGG